MKNNKQKGTEEGADDPATQTVLTGWGGGQDTRSSLTGLQVCLGSTLTATLMPCSSL